MLHVLALSVIAVVLRHPEFMIEQDAPALPTPLSEIEKTNEITPNLDHEVNLEKQYTLNSYRTFLNRRALDYRKLNAI
jgi:hypothetical protein